MASLEQVKDLIKKELAPIYVQVKELTENYKELCQSMEMFSSKYDELLNQFRWNNAKLDQQSTDLFHLKQEITIIDRRATQQADDLAQYLRRDCLEITGIILL